MATTVRVITAASSGATPVESNQEVPCPKRLVGPFNRNPHDLNCQHCAPYLAHIVDCAVGALLVSHAATKGATIDLVRGNLVGQRLFSVAAFPRRTAEFFNSPTSEDVHSFIVNNLDVLFHRNRAVGSWFDIKQGIHSLDIVVCFAERSRALKIAAQLRERFIYDLLAQENIAVEESTRTNV